MYVKTARERTGFLKGVELKIIALETQYIFTLNGTTFIS